MKYFMIDSFNETSFTILKSNVLLKKRVRLYLFGRTE